MASTTVSCDDCDWEKEVTASSEEQLKEKAQSSLRGHKIHCSGSSEKEDNEDQDTTDKENQNTTTEGSGLSIPSIPWKIVAGAGIGLGLLTWYRNRNTDSQEEDSEDQEDNEDQESSSDSSGLDDKKGQPSNEFY